MPDDPALEAPQIETALVLKDTLERLAEQECGCLAIVSEAGCRDVINHHERDLRKLAAEHPHGVHPTKHIGYLVFWVRKLKPIAMTFRISDVIEAGDGELPPAREIASDNEILALYLAQHLLLSYASDGFIPDDLPDSQREGFRVRLAETLAQVLATTTDVGPGVGSTFQSLVYDMRYRTFGPHHVVHFLNHVIFAAKAGTSANP